MLLACDIGVCKRRGPRAGAAFADLRRVGKSNVQAY